MTTATKAKCADTGCNKPATRDGFCQGCFTRVSKIKAKEAAAKRKERKLATDSKYEASRIGLKQLIRLRAVEDGELIKAIHARCEQTGISVNALVSLALARYLKVKTPPRPSAGRPMIGEAELGE